MQTIYTDRQYLRNCLHKILNGKKTSNIDESFIKNHNDSSNKGYIFEIEVKYPKQLHDPRTKQKMPVLGKDELGKKFMTEFEGLRPETYPYLIDDGSV